MVKSQQRVTIPELLHTFLRDVQAKIDAGDEETLIESDDLLQSPDVYGGLVDAQEGVFCFRFFKGSSDETWDMCFRREELKAIAAGETAHLNLWKCGNPTCQCLYERQDAYCPNCDDPEDFI